MQAADALPPFDQAPKRGAPVFVGLQYLRAVAALLVVYYHAVIQVHGVYGILGAPLFGRSGVDVFFVLSGFVMWTSTMNGRILPGAFLRRRIARIVPLYWAVTLVAAGIALLAPTLLRSTGFDLPHVIASLLFVPWINPMALRNGLSETIVPVVVPGWTLNFEMLFYLLFALALLAPLRQRAWVVLGLVLAAFVAAVLLRPLAAAPQFYAQSIIFEFVAGVGLGVLTMRGRSLPAALALPTLVLGGVALVWLDWLRPELDRLFFLGLPAIIVVAAMLALERAGQLRMVGWIDELGNASYSIYLVHIYVIALLRVVLEYSRINLGAALAPAFIGVSLLVSAVAGVALYRWLEVPAVRVARRMLRA